MTKQQTFIPDKNGTLRVETHRSGIFVFQIGLDFNALELPYIRAQEAYARFASMPKVGDIANELERLTLVTSVHSTNSIEGGELDEIQTQVAIDLKPEDVKTEAQRRVTNLKGAYELAAQFADFSFNNFLDENQQEEGQVQGILKIAISEEMITDLHQCITAGLTHEDNTPGTYRNNPKTRKTQVGDAQHGGVYTPPKCVEDIALIMQAFVAWANSDAVMELPPLLRAPLLHYYLELIHPFWDGNGRTGRVIEALTLQCARYQYAPYAISRYYLDHLDEYFALFNHCRKLAKEKEEYPNTEFVRFHLNGFLSTINRLHDRANNIISMLLYKFQINQLHESKEINSRQFTILSQLEATAKRFRYEELKAEPWYRSLYLKLTNRTMKRDLEKLTDLGMIRISSEGKIEIQYAVSPITLSEYPVTAV
nr:Fic family protein [uncultured Desulfuromonas sp.]